ncbi:MBL fold metallo-hydrolase [uncultured Marivirga sp.]|uniref:ComEC/Rec2 family competence protein n=1 Tax=uncultured Marivirga sp. TaxID=1123707 RepID=UPI0030EE5DAE|tara:strand:- start:31532 stop:32593 length:1062 start_codon:yes stop_codon:yes gene_type:complete
MNGIIKILNVGDGDAIIVHLNKDNKDLVMVVDGGQPWHYEKVMKPALVELLSKLDKSSPDIVVATHYDSDHIGGLIPLVQDYIEGIKEVWVHRSPELSQDEKAILESFDKKKDFQSFSQFVFESRIINKNSSIKEEAIREKSSFVIESLRQLETFLGLLPPSKVREVFYGDSVDGWPEIKVLGPLQNFYDELFPQDKSLDDIIVGETIDYLNESLVFWRKRKIELINHGEAPCQFLKNDSTVRLTPTNKASIIFAIDKDDKRFLFTGDAGISSFKAIPNWEEELRNIHWLKIPHHGSNNNISKEIIDVMKPSYSDNSGDRHQDKPVLDCISKNSRSKRDVRSTKTLGSIEFEI